MASTRKWDMHREARDWRWGPRGGADDQQLAENGPGKQWVGDHVEKELGSKMENRILRARQGAKDD